MMNFWKPAELKNLVCHFRWYGANVDWQKVYPFF